MGNSPEERAAYLDQACGNDQQLRADVEHMLAAQGESGSFLESPLLGFDATVIPGAYRKDLGASLDADLAQTAFDGFRLAQRWSEATVFSSLLLKQKPEDSILWIKVSPTIVLAQVGAAYRSGDVESAVKYVTQSKQLKPVDRNHAMNLAVLALAQHQLKHPDESEGNY